MSSPFRHPKFRELQSRWYDKLKESGFNDIENKKEKLKEYDRRTIAFDNRDAIRDFFIRLDHFITKSHTLPPPHKKILELYSNGLYLSEIAQQMNCSRSKIKLVVYHYKKLIF